MSHRPAIQTSQLQAVRGRALSRPEGRAMGVPWRIVAGSLLTVAVALALAGCGTGGSDATTVSAGSPVGVSQPLGPESLARQIAAATTTTTVDPTPSAEDKAVAGAK